MEDTGSIRFECDAYHRAAMQAEANELLYARDLIPYLKATIDQQAREIERMQGELEAAQSDETEPGPESNGHVDEPRE